MNALLYRSLGAKPLKTNTQGRCRAKTGPATAQRAVLNDQPEFSRKRFFLKLTRDTPTQSRRDTWLDIDMGALEHNAAVLRKGIPHNKEIMAILKADAYGHGAVMVLPALQAYGVTQVGVASIDEALQIREAGFKLPILVIGTVPDWSIEQAINQNIQLTVFDPHHLASIERAAKQLGKPASVHIKVDTGMHRIGIHWDKASQFITDCQGQSYLNVEGVFSHLASPDNEEITKTQALRWDAVINALDKKPHYIHISNSLGACKHPQLKGNLVRLGIHIYGYSKDTSLNLKPVMGVKARIAKLETLDPQVGVSYGHTYHTPNDRSTVIATLPIGYADGVPRGLSNNIEGLCHGKRVPQVGTITMDQLMMDVSGVGDVKIGDVVTLIGQEDDERITLSDWAIKLGTIEYELMCGLRVRLPKTYTR